MKIMVNVLIVFISFGFLDFSHASVIRYDITGGGDTEGYSFTGYVDIDSVWYYNGEPYGNLEEPGRRLYYNISEYLFATEAGNCYGYTGYLGLEHVSGASTAHFDHSNIENYVGKDNFQYWYNGSTGVWFDQVNNDYRDWVQYTFLPEIIYICPDLMRSAFDVTGEYWGPATGGIENLIRLTRSFQPVPEPSTLFLIVTGMILLFRMRNHTWK